MTRERLMIARLGQRGEGVADTRRGPVFVPFALPGDHVLVDAGNGALPPEIVERRADRVAPVCSYFGSCGGCAVQDLPPTDYAAWKRSLVVDALVRIGLTVEVAPLVGAHGAGRRRATFHARVQPSANVLREPRLRTGFMRARSHEVIDITQCPVLAPEMAGALEAAHRLATRLSGLGKPLDIVVTATDTGLDVDLRGCGPLPDDLRQSSARLAAELDLARLSNHGETVLERRAPTLPIGKASVTLPAGAFLQATAGGEAAMAERVAAGVGAARKVADLFCGVGTFALRLAEHATVTAVDTGESGLTALRRAARGALGLCPVEATVRDLFRRPLTLAELAGFEAVVFDPPRAGAAAQAEALAASGVPTVVAVSCNPVTFARDAATLVSGGYALESVVPIDQFLFSPHVEIVAVLRRPAKAKKARRLFG